MTRMEFLETCIEELESAKKKYHAFNSTHEGYAVIKEEVDELWDEIKSNHGINANREMVKECVQIIAMTLRFVEDLYE